MVKGRTFAIDWLKNNKPELSETDLYFFGLYTGKSCEDVANYMKKYNLIPSKFIGFDSFEGLPEEKPGIEKHPDWLKGAFDSRTYFKDNDTDNVELTIKNNFKTNTGYDLETVKGFYSDSLTENLVDIKKLKIASFVDVDVDLYISCFQLMDWMSKNNLIKNTVFYFDDWWNSTEPHTYGEALALTEICEKYNFNKKELFNNGLQAVCLLNF